MNARLIILVFVSAMFAGAAVRARGPAGDPRWVPDARFAYRSLAAIQSDVHGSLRAEALSRRQGPNASEVMRLIDLYHELAVHPKRDHSDVLTQSGLKLRSRLEAVRDRIGRQNSNLNRHEKKSIRPVLAVPETDVLAQQVAVPGGAARGQGPQPGAARTIDYGPELVELIQQTISPATWDINGGNGSVVYFAPLRVIVVRAPANVHGQIGDVLGQLRAAP